MVAQYFPNRNRHFPNRNRQRPRGALAPKFILTVFVVALGVDIVGRVLGALGARALRRLIPASRRPHSA